MATPTVRLRRLAAELRRLREAVGLTQAQVTARTGVSEPSLVRAENARGKPQSRTLTALLDLYGVSDAERTALLELYSTADQRGMHTTHGGGLPGEYPAYTSFESEAVRVLTYQGQAVPGLLQTADYARSVLTTYIPVPSEAEVSKLVDTRLRRQEVLQRDNPLQLFAILDEAVLRREVGGPAIMQAQRERLAEDAKRPNVTIQVLPFSAGAHVAMEGSFVALEFVEPYPPLVYLEYMAGDDLLEDDSEIARIRSSFDALSAESLDPDESLRLLQSL